MGGRSPASVPARMEHGWYSVRLTSRKPHVPPLALALGVESRQESQKFKVTFGPARTLRPIGAS